MNEDEDDSASDALDVAYKLQRSWPDGKWINTSVAPLLDLLNAHPFSPLEATLGTSLESFWSVVGNQVHSTAIVKARYFHYYDKRVAMTPSGIPIGQVEQGVIAAVDLVIASPPSLSGSEYDIRNYIQFVVTEPYIFLAGKSIHKKLHIRQNLDTSWLPMLNYESILDIVDEIK